MMYEDDSIKTGKTANQNDDMDLQSDEIVADEVETDTEQDFDDICSDYDTCTGSGESKVKKYGLITLVAVIFLGLFSGIMLRLDRLEGQMAASKENAAALEATVIQKTKTMEDGVMEMKKTFQAIEDRLDVIAKANTGAIAAVEEMKDLYKSTDQMLRETLVARDQLIREIIGNLRLP